MIVEVYRKGHRSFCAASKDTDVIAEILRKREKNIDADAVVASLIEQAKDPNKFPNAVFFLDWAPTLGIGEFMVP
jgi:hypothetical protein